MFLSISMDKDRDKWKEYVKENNMDWIQYRHSRMKNFSMNIR